MRKYARRKQPSKNKRYMSSQSDITLNQYADADTQKLRVSKGAANAIQTEVRNLQNIPIDKSKLEKEDVSWFDKDIDDLEICEPESEDTTENINQNKVFKYQSQRIKRHYSEGFKYPIDLWIALSRHIKPEQIQTFAQICQATNAVVHTVQFWKNLYCRFCQDQSELPDGLKIETLERINGLRQRVIRALYYIYPSFITKITRTLPFEDEPHILAGHRCMLTWHEKVKNVYNFNFKFKKERIYDINKLHYFREIADLRNGYKDLYFNCENDYYVLEVTCQTFLSVLPVMGLVLSNVYLKLSSDMRYHCLKLVFDTNIKGIPEGNRKGVEDTVIVLDPVLNLKIYPWWHPKYPFTNN